MRVTIFITILLLACCLSADAKWFRSCKCVRCNNWVSPFQLTRTHKRDDWQGSMNESVDTKAGTDAKSNLGKRSAESPGYDVTLLANPCDFEVYDVDRNGEITVDEFQDKFGESGTDAVSLFNDLDSDPENDIITAKEFSANAQIINGCAEDK